MCTYYDRIEHFIIVCKGRFYSNIGDDEDDDDEDVGKDEEEEDGNMQ